MTAREPALYRWPKLPPMLQYEDYTVGWICALPVEAEAALSMLDARHRGAFPSIHGDDNQYTPGEIAGHKVVIACLPKRSVGTVNAAYLVSQMRQSFPNLKFGLMVGIGAGVPGKNLEPDIRLGDVVVATPSAKFNSPAGVIGYELGAETVEGFIPRDWQAPTDRRLRNALESIERDAQVEDSHDFLEHLTIFELNNKGKSFLHPGVERDQLYKGDQTDDLVLRQSRPSKDPAVHYGPIASGNSLIKNARLRDALRDKYGIICFEMEAAGLMNTMPVAVIRGVCDYADSHKNDVWHRYAAATAAAYAKGLLNIIGAEHPAGNATDLEHDRKRIEIDESHTKKMLQSAINELNFDQFLPMLSGLDQDEHISTIPSLDSDDPSFCWIFSNLDFQQWSAARFPVLWLSGLPKCNLDQVSSYIVKQERVASSTTDNCVLYFFCSSAIGRASIISYFVHTLLKQMVDCSQMDRRTSIIQNFLHGLLEEAFKKETVTTWDRRGFDKQDSSDITLLKILDAPENELLTALGTVLGVEQRSLSLVVDGLDKVELQRNDFIKGLREFVVHLQRRLSKARILLTNRPQDDIKEIFDGIPCIEHDRERRGSLHLISSAETELTLMLKECLDSLQFENTRYSKITPEHGGSFEWIWKHDEYAKWSKSDKSQLLYVQGKPGSGKSTLTKYFNNKLLEREPAANPADSTVVTKFFYSFREGELQTSHYNMFRSILYDLLDKDEVFFYHRFQAEYRKQRRSEAYGETRIAWDYESLKRVLKSLQDYPLERRLYLIIDAVDESEENDRYNVLELLFELCSQTKYCITKVFIASRPVEELEARKRQSYNFIRLQDETKSDISNFAHSFLASLQLRDVLIQAEEYIVQNSQGVFLWVKLIGEELKAYEMKGYSEEKIFELLKQLPTELKDFYDLMLDKMIRKESSLNWIWLFGWLFGLISWLVRWFHLTSLDRRKVSDLQDRDQLRDGIKIFQFVLFGARPLAVDELRHTLGIPDNPNTEFTPSMKYFRQRIPPEQRINYCGGNFLEIKPYDGNAIVQVMHRTVREFFLNPGGRVANSEYKMCKKDAHTSISITCIRYLTLVATNTSLAKSSSDIRSWSLAHFEGYAQYLDGMPLAKYALCHLKHHIDGSQQDATTRGINSQFINGLTDNPAVYLLESWVNLHWNEIHLTNDQGAAKDFRDKVLHTAARNGLSTAAEVLLTVGATVNARNHARRTPLSWAAEKGHRAVAKLLLEKGAEIESEDTSSRTPLLWAAEKGHRAVVKLLLEKGAEIESKDDSSRTPLLWAAERGHEAVVNLLLEKGAEIESKNIFGQTSLSCAAERGHDAVVKLLLGKGAMFDSKSALGQTPLSWAAARGHEAVVKLLLDKGATLEFKDAYGQTPLFYAVVKGRETVVKLLLDKGAEPESKDKTTYNRTPLSYAAAEGYETIVKLLLEKGAKLESQSTSGRTPLIWAKERGHKMVVKLLLEKGAVR